jgi:hypothetical protein
MKMKLLLIACLAVPAAAQTTEGGQRSVVEFLERLKISGYIQPQYVHSESSDEFSVRRGRVKFTYQATPTSRFVLQPDISSSGVSLKDGYAELIEPWTSWRNTLTAGQFTWPFGFELLYSSSRREMPERTRVVRALFPGERDRGVMLSGGAATGVFNYRLAIVNGEGTTDTFDENDGNAVVGRLGWSFGPVDIGLSGFRDSDKQREGIDLQWTTPLPGLALRGEYIQGEQPASADVEGWYVYVIQKIGSRHQLAARADEYEATRTIGGSYIFHWDANSKVMLAYEQRELWTLRYQYSF